MDHILEKIILKNKRIGNDVFDRLDVFLDEEHDLVVIPTLYSAYLDRTGIHIVLVKIIDNEQEVIKVEEREINPATISTYINCVYQFLKYLNEKCKEGESTISVHQTYRVNYDFLYEYLNTYLVDELKKPEKSLETNRAALSSYFNFLGELGLRKPELIPLNKDARVKARRENTNYHIHYLAIHERNDLLDLCNTDRNKLILKMGWEVGLRTQENQGILLKRRNETKGYLLDLFEKIDDKKYEYLNQFEYTLHGQYAKRGKTRKIYFSRQLLEEMRNYYNIERKLVVATSEFDDPDNLYINACVNRSIKGTVISKEKATSLFEDLRNQLEFIDQKHSYHDCRHTFATELYDSQIQRSGNEDTALFVVAERLGHSWNRQTGKVSSTTREYVAMREQMIEKENKVNDY